jgi:hypothetical protein
VLREGGFTRLACCRAVDSIFGNRTWCLGKIAIAEKREDHIKSFLLIFQVALAALSVGEDRQLLEEFRRGLFKLFASLLFL